MWTLCVQKNSLRGEHVAFTGLLRDTGHRRALSVVEAAGGIPSPRVSRRSTLLVVGMRGWRGMGDGVVSGKLRRAEEWRNVGCGPRIISERTFWARVSGKPDPTGAMPVCTMAQATVLSGLTEEQLRRCAQLGLVRSEDDGLCFEDLLTVRTIVRTLEQGVSLATMADKWASLSRLLPETAPQHSLPRLINDPIGGLALLLAEGVRVGEFGQLLLDFKAKPPLRTAPEVVPLACGAKSSDPVLSAAELLEEGAFAEAEASLQRALDRYPDEMGILVALSKLCIEQERYGEAEALLRRVLATCPQQLDALFCLALCCEEQKKHQEAIGLWRAFLRLAPAGERTIIAQAHLLRPITSPRAPT